MTASNQETFGALRCGKDNRTPEVHDHAVSDAPAYETAGIAAQESVDQRWNSHPSDHESITVARPSLYRDGVRAVVLCCW
jgi:hypothetical protein